MDNDQIGKYDLHKYCKVLAKEFKFASELNSMARQSAAERAWSAISRFYDNCKKKVKDKKAVRPRDDGSRKRSEPREVYSPWEWRPREVKRTKKGFLNFGKQTRSIEPIWCLLRKRHKFGVAQRRMI
ncbi:hypothetical protein [Okeania hirsuta]|uniref:hypothetical protein n=1 Tax=Okeania TaxID=1458928 RepID=UPI0026A0AA3B